VTVDPAAERVLRGDGRGDELHTARLQLAERRLHDALTALEDAERRDNAPEGLRQLEATYRQELICYEALCRGPNQNGWDE
jgi:hypothetical protein